MKICLMSDINNPHTIKWCHELEQLGIDYYVISLTRPLSNHSINGHVYSFEENDPSAKKEYKKITYLLNVKDIKRILKNNPVDIIHAHYASSYGLLSILSQTVEKKFLTVWGSDILIFPKKSFLHTKIIKFVLSRTDKIIATSDFLTISTRKYTNKEVLTVPFYIDEHIFTYTPPKKKSLYNIFCIAKSLKKIYGYELLLKAFNQYVKEVDREGHLYIAGEGYLRPEIECFIQKEGLENNVTLLGQQTSQGLAKMYSMSDIAIYPSLSESFGVSSLEAQMAGLPVIASDIPAFRETIFIKDNLVKKNNQQDLFEKMVRLSQNYPNSKDLENVSYLVKKKYSRESVHSLNKKIYE